MRQLIQSYIDELHTALAHVPAEQIEAAARALDSACRQRRFVYVLGNGGSAANASHFANELGKGVIRPDCPRFRVLALTDSIPLLTAWANDNGYEVSFAEQLANLVEAGDVVIAISGSGKSPNVLRAAAVAREAGARLISLTGFDGGLLRPMADISVHVPSHNMRLVEDAHSALMHVIGQCVMTL